jgi:hypothetical protein
MKTYRAVKGAAPYILNFGISYKSHNKEMFWKRFEVAVERELITG